MMCETLDTDVDFLEEEQEANLLDNFEVVVDEDAELTVVPNRSDDSRYNHLPALLSEKDMARKVVGCGKRTLWRYSRSGVSPRPIKVGGLVRYRTDEYLRWIKEGCPRCDNGKQSSRQKKR